jgi:hypothetical protein
LRQLYACTQCDENLYSPKLVMLCVELPCNGDLYRQTFSPAWKLRNGIKSIKKLLFYRFHSYRQLLFMKSRSVLVLCIDHSKWSVLRVQHIYSWINCIVSWYKNTFLKCGKWFKWCFYHHIPTHLSTAPPSDKLIHCHIINWLPTLLFVLCS